MITEIHSNRIVVISDLHLGNPFCVAKKRIIEFLKWAARYKYDICINGDGFDIAQVSFHKLVNDIPDILRVLKKLGDDGSKIYYVVGNHDFLLENFLSDWGTIKISPFINLNSGTKRFRIEHGHLYDPFFVSWPVTYEFLTRVAGWFLNVFPGFYRLWMTGEKLFFSFFHCFSRHQIDEPPQFAIAAREMALRGFDGVIFGHTHHVGQEDVLDGVRYLNPGSWLMGSCFVEIIEGEPKLKNWVREISNRS